MSVCVFNIFFSATAKAVGYDLPFSNEMKHILSVFIVLGLFVGCNEQKLPPDIPKLSPCKITITQGGSPLAGASVFLEPVDAANKKWNASGSTDASGTAEMRTQGMYAGAVAGKHKVVVSKMETIPVPQPARGTPEYDAIMRGGGAQDDVYALVDEKFGSTESSTLEIEVGTVKSHTLDVGVAVRVMQPKR